MTAYYRGDNGISALARMKISNDVAWSIMRDYWSGKLESVNTRLILIRCLSHTGFPVDGVPMDALIGDTIERILHINNNWCRHG